MAKRALTGFDPDENFSEGGISLEAYRAQVLRSGFVIWDYGKLGGQNGTFYYQLQQMIDPATGAATGKPNTQYWGVVFPTERRPTIDFLPSKDMETPSPDGEGQYLLPIGERDAPDNQCNFHYLARSAKAIGINMNQGDMSFMNGGTYNYETVEREINNKKIPVRVLAAQVTAPNGIAMAAASPASISPAPSAAAISVGAAPAVAIAPPLPVQPTIATVVTPGAPTGPAVPPPPPVPPTTPPAAVVADPARLSPTALSTILASPQFVNGILISQLPQCLAAMCRLGPDLSIVTEWLRIPANLVQAAGQAGATVDYTQDIIRRL